MFYIANYNVSIIFLKNPKIFTFFVTGFISLFFFFNFLNKLGNNSNYFINKWKSQHIDRVLATPFKKSLTE